MRKLLRCLLHSFLSALYFTHSYTPKMGYAKTEF